MEKILIIIGALVAYGLFIFFLFKWMKSQRIKDMIRIANEMVETGDITRKEGDAIIWLINKASGKK